MRVTMKVTGTTDQHDAAAGAKYNTYEDGRTVDGSYGKIVVDATVTNEFVTREIVGSVGCV